MGWVLERSEALKEKQVSSGHLTLSLKHRWGATVLPRQSISCHVAIELILMKIKHLLVRVTGFKHQSNLQHCQVIHRRVGI